MRTKIKLINTGTIDPFQLLWAQNPIKYLKNRISCPIIDAKIFQDKFPKRYQQL